MMRSPLARLADRTANVPASATERLDVARGTVAALRVEERRLEQLGIEPALTRCRAELRYWSFVHATLQVASRNRTALPEGW